MKNCVCQSCGMLIEGPEMYGTDLHGLPIEDYCVYCYKEGEFTRRVTMEEMIRLCSNYVAGNSKEMFIADMRAQYPHLKRWARKEDTQHEYYRAINRVLEYIQTHLHEQTDLKTLSAIACISPYHFHRIFKSVIGESVGEYAQRLRLEYVAEQLKVSALPLGELAERSGYSSEQALSRAFKNYFGLPPKVFKASFFREKFSDELVPRICKVAAKHLVFLRDDSGKKEWQRLYAYAMVHRLLSEHTESVELFRDGRFLPALTVKEPVSPAGVHAEAAILPEGLHAIFTHKGDTRRVPELMDAVFNYWLPSGKYELGTGMPYVIYLSNPAATALANLLTEIYFPVREKKKGG